MSDNDPQVQPDMVRNSPSGEDPVDASRMSLGDHLDELRQRMVLTLIGVGAGAAISLFFAKDILSILLQPLVAVLYAHGLPTEVQSLGPPDTFLIYLKVGLLTGLVLTFPWVLYQIWLFIAAGLYEREQMFVRRFAPVSTLLFFAGVAFMYLIVLPIIMNFFVGFNSSIKAPQAEPTQLQRWLLSITSDYPIATQPAEEAVDLLVIPLLEKDPTDPEPGTIWFNETTQRLSIQTSDGTIRKPFGADTPISSRFGLNFYISLVLMLALAFGLAFEVPIVVILLVLLRLVSVQTMRASRKFVILGTLVLSAILTPPDVVSQVLLAVPMLLLFEGGLIIGRTIEKGRPEE